MMALIPKTSDEEKKNFAKNKYINDKKLFCDKLRESRKIVFFGGAGVSTESGIPDFRSADGLYSERVSGYIKPEEILSRSFFDAHTKDFYKFYRDKMIYLDAMPNQAHKKLAELEAAGKDITVITQNIDGLHQMAGSKKVIELHGSIHRNHCMKCHQAYNLKFIANDRYDVPQCSLCGGVVKPDVVLYEEQLNDGDVRAAIEAISECDMLIIAGTSLVVYPAAGFINYFRGDTSVVINLSTTEKESRANIIFHEKVGSFLGSIDVNDCI